MAWLLATKLEMTRIVKGNDFIPVTLLKVPVLKVVWVKTLETDWYNSLVLWVLDNWKEGLLKEWNKTLSFNDFSTIKEILLKDNEVSKFNVWDNVSLDMLEWIELVEITGISKWKWFAWVVKRYHFAWGCATHWSKFHRAIWSIGTRKPRRTKKGKRMHWHMWSEQITIKKVQVEIINKDLSVIWVRGPVPGARNSLLVLKF